MMMCQEVMRPGRCGRLTPPTPLRTVRESFPSHGSSLSKDAPVRGIPAIGWINVSILSPLYARQDHLTSAFAGKGPPGKTPAALKILGVDWVIRVGLSSDLDMAFKHCAGDGVQAQHLAFARARPYPRGKPK